VHPHILIRIGIRVAAITAAIFAAPHLYVTYVRNSLSESLMPAIPATPGDFISLFNGVFRLYQNPSSWEATEQLQKEFTGYAAISFQRHFGGSEVKLTQDDLELIALGKPDRVPLAVKLKELIYGTATAGHVLVYTLRLAKHMPRLASAATAMRILEWRYTAEAQRWAASPSSIKTAWRKYRPIAHFIGAASLIPDEYAELSRVFSADFDVSNGNLPYLPASPDIAAKVIGDAANIGPRLERAREVLLPLYFAHAEALRRAGEEHFATGQEDHGHSLLDPLTSWSVPGEFKLPRIQLSLPPLSDEELKAASVK